MAFPRAATASLIAILTVSAVSAAYAKPVVVVTLSQTTVVTAADGSQNFAALTDGVPVVRGTVIRYTVNAKDTSADPARRLALVGHVPSEIGRASCRERG